MLQRFGREACALSHNTLKKVEESLNKASKSSLALLCPHRAGRLIKFFCENPAEIFGIIKADFEGYFADGQLCGLQEGTGFGQPYQPDELYRGKIGKGCDFPMKGLVTHGHLPA